MGYGIIYLLFSRALYPVPVSYKQAGRTGFEFWQKTYPEFSAICQLGCAWLCFKSLKWLSYGCFGQLCYNQAALSTLFWTGHVKKEEQCKKFISFYWQKKKSAPLDCIYTQWCLNLHLQKHTTVKIHPHLLLAITGQPRFFYVLAFTEVKGFFFFLHNWKTVILR